MLFFKVKIKCPHIHRVVEMELRYETPTSQPKTSGCSEMFTPEVCNKCMRSVLNMFPAYPGEHMHHEEITVT